MVTQYTYRPLNPEKKEIRLLHLSLCDSPIANIEFKLKGTLEHVALSDHPQYTALSYVWGDPDFSSKIFIGDDACIKINKNLYKALEDITTGLKDEPSPLSRSPQEDFCIWIDAVCINQRSSEEKSWQVAMMGDIYSCATFTFAYIGSFTKDTDRAIDVLKMYSEMVLAHSTRFNLREDVQFVVKNAHENSTEAVPERLEELTRMIYRFFGRSNKRNGTIPDQALVTSIMDRPWWYRTWTLQEYLLSKKLQFVRGHRRFEPLDVFPALNALLFARLAFPSLLVASHQSLLERRGDDMLQFLLPPCRRMGKKIDPNEPFKKFSLSTVLSRRKHLPGSRQTDPRDAVYGVLGFVEQDRDSHSYMNIDYSLDCASVYVRAARIVLEAGNNRTLRTATHRKEIENLPSWVTDWSVDDRSEKIKMAKVVPVAAQRLLYLNSERKKHILTLPGHLIGTIKPINIHRCHQGNFSDSEIIDAIALMSNKRAFDEYFSGLRNRLSQLKAPCYSLEVQINMLSLAITSQSCKDIENHRLGLWEPAVEALKTEVSRSLGNSLSFRNRTLFLRDTIANPAATSNSPHFNCPQETIKVLSSISPKEYPGPPSTEVRSLSQNGSVLARRTMFNAAYVLKRRVPFIANDALVGIADERIKDGDSLVAFDMDPTAMYVVRSKNDDLWELITLAFVPQSHGQEDFLEAFGERRDFQLC